MCASSRICCTARWRWRPATRSAAPIWACPKRCCTTPRRLGPRRCQRLPAPCRARGTDGGSACPPTWRAYLDDVERDILERALERHRYNRTAAGASLGLSLRQMRYRMARLGVGAAEGPAERGEPA